MKLKKVNPKKLPTDNFDCVMVVNGELSLGYYVSHPIFRRDNGFYFQEAENKSDLIPIDTVTAYLPIEW